MTGKDQMIFRIDPDIAWQFRQKVREGDRSAIVQQFIKTYCEENEESATEQKLREEKESLQGFIDDYRRKLGVLNAKIIKLEEKKKAQKKEDVEEKRRLVNSMKNAGVFR